MKPIMDAVSVVLSCGDQIFMIKRQLQLKAFPGYWAFPGGKVDAGDEALAPAHDLIKNFDKKLIGAVIREIKEELSIDLAVALQEHQVTHLDYLGLAVTPDFNPQRFSTHFFKVTLTIPLDFVMDTGEVMNARWASASSFLDQYERGDMLSVPPVVQVIKALGLDPKAHQVPTLAFSYDKEHEVPMIESIYGIRQIMPLSNTLPPANRTNSFLIGDHRKLLLDPSPKDHDELSKMRHVANKFGVDAIFLTHHHGDHHEYAQEIAHRYKLPIMLSADTHRRLKKINPDYFLGLNVVEVKEGDEVTHWLGHSVKVYEVPGHDEGQLALAPDNMAWFIAGDLFQGVGTVVIGGDEGDMAKYMKTLERVIALKPKVLFPSHGIGLGGTGILAKTLEHRKIREEQVLSMTKAGKDPQEILSELYSDIPLALHKYALMNIHSHLTKLKNEGLL